MTPAARRWRFGLVGHPVAHSRSPALFAALAAAADTACAYTLFDVAPEDFDPWWRDAAGVLDAFNVTLPHKTTAAARCRTVTDSAARVGAVNAVRLGPDGGAHGTNTDVAGFAATLGELAFETAVVIGAGGAARAVVDALLARGVARLRLVNRSPERAAALLASRSPAERARMSVRAWPELPDALSGADLVVQTTSAALTDPTALEALPWPRTRPGALAVDLVYRPRVTAFLRGAERHGRPTADGLTMLAGQAVAAFDFFRGVERTPADLSEATRHLADSLRAGVD